jgi:peptidoglycan/LPS O-acetylase OafA/YrhL
MPYGVVSYFTVFTSVSIVSVAVAYLSYEYFEKPFLRMKKRYELIPAIPYR